MGLSSPTILEPEPVTAAKEVSGTEIPKGAKLLQGEPKKLQDIFNFTKPIDKTHSVRQVNAFDKLL